MKAKTLVCAVVQEYLNSILKAQMHFPFIRQTSGFGFVLLLEKIIRSNEVPLGLPQCPRCFYVTCIWNNYMTSKMGSLQGYFASGSLKASLHWLSAPGVFVCLAWRLPRLSQWSLCLPAWRKFSLVAARFRRCLCCIYPLFIWRMSSAYSVWGGIVSWLLWSVLNATAGFSYLF